MYVHVGLDESDNESTVSSTLGTCAPEAVREYDCVETTRVFTPIHRESKGVCVEGGGCVIKDTCNSLLSIVSAFILGSHLYTFFY